MFLVPINAPGITMRRIKQVDGRYEFCEEFFDGLELGDDAVVGEVNDGWAVASRSCTTNAAPSAAARSSPAGSAPRARSDLPIDYVELLEPIGQPDNERLQELAGRALVRRAVQEQLIDHVYHGVNDGTLPPTAGTIIRISHAETLNLEIDTTLADRWHAGVVDTGDGLFAYGERYLLAPDRVPRRRHHGSGRNVIGERVLGFPREYAADKGVPFNQVKRGRRQNTSVAARVPRRCRLDRGDEGPPVAAEAVLVHQLRRPSSQRLPVVGRQVAPCRYNRR